MVKNSRRKFVKGDTCVYGNDTFTVTGATRKIKGNRARMYYTIRNKSGSATVRSDHLVAC